jgi:hypothetical protein
MTASLQHKSVVTLHNNNATPQVAQFFPFRFPLVISHKHYLMLSIQTLSLYHFFKKIMQNLKTTLQFFLLLFLLNAFQTNAQTLCQNPTNGGSIAGEQTICANTQPSTIVNINLPSGGGTNTLEYVWIKWKVLPQSAPQAFTMIENSNTAHLDPGPLSETTWFRRCSRRQGCDDYVAETNIVKIIVNNPIEVDFALTQPTCTQLDGSLKIAYLPAGYTTSIDNQPLTADKTNYTNITSGSHTITVSRGGCGLKTVSFTINQPENTTPTPTFEVTAAKGVEKGSITLTNLPNDYYSQLDFGQRNINQKTYSNLETGLHTLIIGIGGCESTVTFTIVALSNCEQVTLPGAIYPNQTICYGTNAGTIFGEDAKYDNVTSVEYSWIVQDTDPINGDNYKEIANTNQTTFEPGPLCGNFWYKRRVRVVGCDTWTMESNWVSIIVTKAVNVRFVNQSACGMKVYSLDGSNETLVGTIETGKNYEQTTIQGQTFRIRSESINALLKEYTAIGCDLNCIGIDAPCVAYSECGAEMAKIETGKTYRIINKATGMALEVQYASCYENAYITQNWVNSRMRQMWIFEDAGNGYIKMKNRATGKYFQVTYGSTNIGTYITQGSANGEKHQEFSFENIIGAEGYFKIVAHHSCLPIKLTSACQYVGGRVIQNTWRDYYESAKWALVEVVNPPALSSVENVFTAFKKDNNASLQWTGKANEPVKYYVIERSQDDKTFTPIEKVDNLNNPDEIQYFQILDKKPYEGNNFYRLRSVYADGSEVTSESELVNMPTVVDLTIYPNPVAEKAFINLEKWLDKTDINLDFYDQAGLKVKTQFIGIPQTESTEIDLNSLNNGAYMVIISAKNTRAVSQKIIVEKLD